jgi:hypothetical protein
VGLGVLLKDRRFSAVCAFFVAIALAGCSGAGAPPGPAANASAALRSHIGVETDATVYTYFVNDTKTCIYLTPYLSSPHVPWENTGAVVLKAGARFQRPNVYTFMGKKLGDVEQKLQVEFFTSNECNPGKPPHAPMEIIKIFHPIPNCFRYATETRLDEWRFVQKSPEGCFTPPGR